MTLDKLERIEKLSIEALEYVGVITTLVRNIKPEEYENATDEVKYRINKICGRIDEINDLTTLKE